MTADTTTPGSHIGNALKVVTEFAKYFRQAKRYEQLFAMNEAQLAARGLSRDGLVRCYITGLGHN